MEKTLIAAIVILVLGLGAVLIYFTLESEDDPARPRPPQVEDAQVPVIEKKTSDQPVPEAPTPGERSAAPAFEAGPAHRLSGTVFDERSAPLPDAEITLFKYRQKPMAKVGHVKIGFEEDVIAKTTAGETGEYEFEGLQPMARNYLSMRIEHPGYVSLLKDHVGPGMIVNVDMLPGAKITGVVKDQDTDRPVAGVTVEVNYKKQGESLHDYARWRHAVTTDANGEFTIGGAPAGDVSVLLEHDDYEQRFFGAKEKIAIYARQDNHWDFKMKRGVVLNGLVVDATTGKPIDDAEVLLNDKIPILPSQKERTGVLGKFKMKGITRGTHPVSIGASGFTDYREMLNFNDGDMAEEIVFKLRPAGSATGLVVDADGKPVEGAQIYVARTVSVFKQVRGYAEATTDSKGRFSVANLNDGEVYLVAAHADGLTLGSSDEFEAISGEFVEDILIQLERGAKLQGRIADPTGVPIAGVTVSVDQPPFNKVWFPPGLPLGQKQVHSLVTDDGGYYSIEGLYTGWYEVTPDHPDYIPLRPQKVQIAAANETINKDFTLQVGHSISGRVVDQFGNEVKGATVTGSFGRTSETRVTARTDEEGRYELARLHDRAYRVRAEGENSAARAVNDVPADSVNIDFVLEEYGSMVGRVVSQDRSQPVTRYKLRVSPLMEVDRSSGSVDYQDRTVLKTIRTHEAFREIDVVSTDGAFEVKRLQPGDYLLEVISDSHRPSEQMDITVQPGAETAVPPVVLFEGARFEGHIKDTLGNPLTAEDVRIRLTAAPGSVMTTRIGANGQPEQVRANSVWDGRMAQPNDEGFFSIGGLPPGKIHVVFTADKFCLPAAEAMEFGTSGVTKRDYEFQRAATVTINVVDENGDPVINPIADVNTPDGARAQVDGRPTMGRGDHTGKLRVKKLLAGTYDLLIRRFGYEAKTMQIRVAEGEHFVGDITLPTLR